MISATNEQFKVCLPNKWIVFEPSLVLYLPYNIRFKVESTTSATHNASTRGIEWLQSIRHGLNAADFDLCVIGDDFVFVCPKIDV